jgi:hypothetical protein
MDSQAWRTRLERDWRQVVDQIVAMSVACHELAPPSETGLAALPALAESAGRGDARLAHLVGRLMAAHDKLAEIEAALARVRTGQYGFCERCSLAMEHEWLSETPHIRTCPDCSLDRVHGPCAAAISRPAPRLAHDLAGIAG